MADVEGLPDCKKAKMSRASSRVSSRIIRSATIYFICFTTEKPLTENVFGRCAIRSGASDGSAACGTNWTTQFGGLTQVEDTRSRSPTTTWSHGVVSQLRPTAPFVHMSPPPSKWCLPAPVVSIHPDKWVDDTFPNHSDCSLINSIYIVMIFLLCPVNGVTSSQLHS
ncbi:hypothetical protein RUM44_001296 [Polyplax serrata]|uniref:Uncharacterized protein n=1 Tax=Polyplax serrata TaxID=468196 RepID=A0ABR1AL55_POLSC